MVLDCVHPAETVHKVTVEHQATSSMKAAAEVFERITQLAARANVPPRSTLRLRSGSTR
jgi:hypothetical protein